MLKLGVEELNRPVNMLPVPPDPNAGVDAAEGPNREGAGVEAPKAPGALVPKAGAGVVPPKPDPAPKAPVEVAGGGVPKADGAGVPNMPPEGGGRGGQGFVV